MVSTGNMRDLSLNNSAVDSHKRAAKIKWVLMYLSIVLVSSYLGYSMYQSQIDWSTLGWLIYFIGVAAIFIQPRFGIYLIVPFTLVYDLYVMWWWPFVTNLSSEESLLYVNDAVILSPLETYIAFTFISWFGRFFVTRKVNIYRGPLFWPAMAFGFFIGLGLVYGVLNGGDFKIALWESRPIFYLPAMVILASNLLTKRKHVVRVMWLAIIALFIEGIMGIRLFFTFYGGTTAGVERITTHSAAIHENSVFIFLFSIFLFKVGWEKRILLLTLLPPIALTYILNQRRSSFIALFVALFLFAPILYRYYRKFLFTVGPIAVVVGILYLGAFWNSGSAIAAPAQAIKSVVSDDANESDRNSNLYRILENANASFTIQTFPITGVGFGNKFLIIAPMADISFFEWWEYITHNSIIWIWMKAGLGGFMSMLMLAGMSIMIGVRASFRVPRNEVGAVVITSTMLVVMHFLFAYVDMSWGQQSMVYVGTMMGIIGAIENILDQPVEEELKRWPWQKDRVPPEGLLPLPEHV